MFPDSRIFRDQFGSASMREVFSDRSLVQQWATCEAALARAQAAVGMIPTAAAESLTAAAADTRSLDLHRMREALAATSHPLMPFLEEFSMTLPADVAGWLHWGATTQDIMDTAVVLQVKEALAIITVQLNDLIGVLVEKATAHRSTPMAGRTHGQHAVPITFGLKLAVLAAELGRHRDRLQELRPRILVGQLGGGAGTLAALGADGLEVRARYCQELGLGDPDSTWHVARDRFAEYVGTAAMLGMTCGRAAMEVIQLQRTEIAEVAEPSTSRSVGSSTMPQKRNPMISENVVALSRLMKPLPTVLLDVMVQTHERDMSTWNAEWAVIAEASILLSGALAQTIQIYSGLAVNTERMEENLGLTQGLITAERVMMTLAPHLGKMEAHSAVDAAARRVEAGGISFDEALLADERIAAVIGDQELSSIVDPAVYTGAAEAMVDSLIQLLKHAEPGTPD